MRGIEKLLGIVVAGGLLAAAPGCDTASDEGTPIGPRGGIVRSDDGRVTLEIPAGALADEVAIQITETDALPQGAAGPAYAIEPFGLTFAYPAMIAYDVAAESMDDVGAARLVTERDHGWDTLADREVDLQTLEVTASVLFAANVGIVD